MKSKPLALVRATSVAFFFACIPALAQNPGAVTNHAFPIGKGLGTTGFGSLLCTGFAVGTGSGADPTCRGIVTGDLPLGTSVLNPGTGVLEAVLPIQTVTGASKAFATVDLFKETRRSNSGSAMTDTFPASSATGLVNGTKITIVNVDATASDTITAGAGTTISGTGIVGPGRAIQYVYDLPNTIWRPTLNTATAGLLAAANIWSGLNTFTGNLSIGASSPFTLRNNGGKFSLVNTAGSVEFAAIDQTGNAAFGGIISGSSLGIGTSTPTTGAGVDIQNTAFNLAVSDPQLLAPVTTFLDGGDAPVSNKVAASILSTLTSSSAPAAQLGSALIVQRIVDPTHGLGATGAIVGGLQNGKTGTDGYGVLGIINNTSAVSIPTGTAVWALVRGTRGGSNGLGLVDGFRSTSELCVSPFLCTPQTVSISLANPAVVTLNNHGFIAGDQVAFENSGGTLPTGLGAYRTTEAVYFVIASGLTTNTFQFSTVPGGSAISTVASAQSGTQFAFSPQTPRAGLFITNSTQSNPYLAGAYVESAVEDGFRMGSGQNLVSVYEPRYPFSYMRKDGSRPFSVTQDGVIHTTVGISVDTNSAIVWSAGASNTGIDFGFGSSITRRSSDGHIQINSQNNQLECVTCTLSSIQNILFNAMAAPATPASGVGTMWFDSTDLRMHDKNVSGVVGTMVAFDAGAANNFLTGINQAGQITKARPTCANLSDSGTGCSGAAGITTLTGDITATGPGSVAATLATVNSNTGSWGTATQSAQFTVNGKGLVTAAANVTITPAVGSLTGLGTGVATALGVNVGSAGAFVTFNGALGTPSSGVATNLTGTASGLTAGNVTTNANLTGDVTSVGNATTLTNAPVIAKVLTGYVSGAGTVSATDSILSAIQKLNGNDALALPKAGGTMSGAIAMGGNNITNAGNIDLTGTANIGAAVAADATLTINQNNGATVAPTAGAGFHLVGTDATNNTLQLDSFAAQNLITVRTAEGTRASKTALASTRKLLNLLGQGWDGSAYAGSANILFIAAENWSGSAHGTYISISTNPIGSTAIAEGLRIQPSGGLSIGAAAIAADPGVGSANMTGSATLASATAVPAGGTAGLGLKMSSTSNLGVFFGSGAPTLSAAQGSIYIRTDGSSTSTRLYINTNGSTTWTNVTTAS